MNNRTLSVLLKLFVLLIGALGLFFFVIGMPMGLRFLMTGYRMPSGTDIPLQMMSGAAGIAFFLALIRFWIICTEIGMNHSFCRKNAEGLKQICILALIDTGLCLAACVYALLIRILHPMLLLAGLGVMSVGGLIAVAAYTLAYLVRIAEQIQIENDLMV